MASVDKEAVRRGNPLEDVIPELTGHPVTGNGTERLTRCHRAGHRDVHPSLRINVEKQRWFCDPCQSGGDVFAFIQEFQGVDFQEALAFLAVRAGLNGNPPTSSVTVQPAGGRGDLAPQKRLESSNTSSGITLAQYADAKGLPEDFLRELDLKDLTYMGAPAVRIPHFDTDGVTEKAVQFRLALAKGERRDTRFKWRKGSTPCLYGLWRLEDAVQANRITIVEGPSDTQTLWHLGVPALGLPSASTKLWEHDDLLAGIGRIEIVIEPDAGGKTVLKAVARAPFRDRVWLVNLGEDLDPSGLYLRDRQHFRQNWQAATEAAPKWSAIEAVERSERANTNFQLARDLLDDPHLMDRIGEMISARGYAGDTRPAQQVYLAMTSRLQARPMNIAVVAQSAAGKNRAVDGAKELIPDEAIHEICASSERALIYDDVDVEHKVMIFAEADSIPEDGPAASAIRSLASDNEMAYDTVEKTAEGLRTRHIRKRGPTGLITTSTKRLPEQMSTRTLELPISDDEAQTRAVLKMQAAEASCLRQDRPSIEPFIALQRWLAEAGLREVRIPFAPELAREIPARAVRMRRDFPQLLACIKAVTMLYQRQREIDDGHIVATLDDYAVARDLLAPVFEAIVSEGCTLVVRQTVEAVSSEEVISGVKLAARLAVASSTLAYRVKRAVAGGWLVNEEQRKGRPARYRRGTPLPDSASALPSVETVTDLFECSSLNPAEEAPPPPSYKEF